MRKVRMVRVRASFGILLMVLSVAIQVFTSDIAHAAGITDSSPNPVDMTTGSDTDAARHILIQSDHGDAFTIKLGLYYLAGASGSKTVRIEGGPTTNCSFYTTHAKNTEIAGSRNLYKVEFGNGTTVYDSYTRTYAQACNSNNRTVTRDFTVSAQALNQAQLDGTTNNRYRKVTMTISLVAGIQNDPDFDGTMTFSIHAFNNALVGLIDTLESKNKPNNTFVSRKGYEPNDVRYTRLEIPFGIDCTLGPKINAEVIMFDADNVPAPSRNDLNFLVQMNLGGGWVTLTRGPGNDQIHMPGPGDPMTGNVDIYADGTVRPKNLSNPGTDGNKAKVEIGLMRSPASGARYRMVVRQLNMQSYNYLYVGLPGDSIFGTNAVNCVHRARASLTINPDVNSHVEVGGTVTTTGTIENTGNATAQLQYFHRIWYGSNTDDYNAGDQGLQQTGWTDVDVASGATRNVNTYTWNPVLSPPGAAYVCASFDIRNRPGSGDDTELLPAARPIIKCTPIAKAPGFTVVKGDVRGGGRFSTGAAAVCTIPTLPGLGSDSNFAPIRGHTYSGARSSTVEYAAITPGRIINIKKPGGIASDLLFGSAGWASPDGRYLGGSFAAQSNVTTHCLPDVRGLYAQFAIPKTTTATTASTSGEYVLDNAGNETFTVCPAVCALPANSRTVIRVSKPVGTPGIKKVVIGSNVVFSGSPYASIDAIPQFVLMVDEGIELEFAPGVTEVNGIVVARGEVRTCGTQKGGPTGSMVTSDCSLKLLMKGILITDNRVYPFRAAGFSSPADPSYAEEFRSIPGVLLSDYARARQQPTISTRYQAELPPRF